MGKHVAGGGRKTISARANARGGAETETERRLFQEMQENIAGVPMRNVRPGISGISTPFKSADLKEFAKTEPKIAKVAKDYLGSGRRLFFTNSRGGREFYQSEGDRITYFIPTGKRYGGRPVYNQTTVVVPMRNAPPTSRTNGVEGYSSPLPSGSYAVRHQTTQYAEMVDITYFR